MSIKIECDECNTNLDNGEEVICRRCYNELVDEKDALEEELQKSIDELTDKLYEALKNKEA